MIVRWQDPRAPMRRIASLVAVLLVLGCQADHGAAVSDSAGSDPPHSGRLSLSIVDAATGEETAVRLRILDADGELAGDYPREAIDVVFGWDDPERQKDTKRQEDGSFYVYGEVSFELAPGTYRLSASKGEEYVAHRYDLVIEPGEELSQPLRMERWIDMPARGWYSADGHVHIRRAPEDDPKILTWMAAEDIHVGALLQMGDPEQTHFLQYAWGVDGVYQWEDYFLTSGQEDPRTHDLGHTISLGASDFVRFPGKYYSYDRVFDRVHELGGLTGYAHQGAMFHGYRGMTLDVLRDKVDFVEILQFCEEGDPLRLEHYYHFLDLGFPLTATAGSDFPWCGRYLIPRIGDPRFYTYVGGELTFESWMEALRAGHTFVSSGPVIELEIDGALPGDTLDVSAGATLSVRASAFGQGSQIPLASLELVAHGEVIGSVAASDSGQSSEHLELAIDLPVRHGLWIAARTRAGPTQAAHTTPIYVRVDGSGFHNPETLSERLDRSEHVLDEIEVEVVQFEGDDHRPGLRQRVEEAREVIGRLRRELVGSP